MAQVTRPVRRRSRAEAPLDADEAFIALLIAAMEASGHASADEGERAQHIIWSTRRFRYRSGEAVGRRVERMRSLIGERGAAAVIEAAARAVPRRLRPTAFAVAADLVLVDGRMDRSEKRFLGTLAADLGLGPEITGKILDVIRLKNSA
jgi:tellurite resistance protein